MNLPADNIAHGPLECLWDNIMLSNIITCECGFRAYGDTWADCGAEMDEHLEEVGIPDAITVRDQIYRERAAKKRT